MTQIETATVIDNKLVNDKFREGSKVRVINLNTYTGKEAVWIKEASSFGYLAPNMQIQVIRNDKGKLSILETAPPRNINGNGLKPIGDTLSGNSSEPIKTNSGAYQVYSNGLPTNESTITNGHSPIEETGLSLPILSDKEKVQLKQYINQQVNMFYYLTQEVTKKFPDLKPNDHRAIAISLFIDSNKLIQSQK